MITWPDGKSFAFTVFDDTDSAVKGNYEKVYALLRDEGLRTTKSVWPLRGNGKAINGGSTCEDADYRTHMLELQRDGFEIGYHGTTYHTVERAEIQRGLERFYQIFGHHPRTMANHFGVAEGIYWGDARLSGAYRFLYNALTRARNKDAFFGHQEGSPYFWGDLCRDHIAYVRNFTTSKINTLKAFPVMPYHDPARKFVQQWFSSSEGSEVSSFVRTISEHNQDRLELEGGACIMYTHFAFGFQDGSGAIDQRFRMLIKRLSKKNGWFVPVATLLDYIRRQRGEHILAPAERSRMERNWLIHKIFSGTA
jgi:hypothetical protein